MPYTPPDVPAEAPKTYDEYQAVVDRLQAAQHDRSWAAVCLLNAGNVDGAQVHAADAIAAQAAAAAYIEKWYPITGRLIEAKYKL